MGWSWHNAATVVLLKISGLTGSPRFQLPRQHCVQVASMSVRDLAWFEESCGAKYQIPSKSNNQLWLCMKLQVFERALFFPMIFNLWVQAVQFLLHYTANYFTQLLFNAHTHTPQMCEGIINFRQYVKTAHFLDLLEEGFDFEAAGFFGSACMSWGTCSMNIGHVWSIVSKQDIIQICSK